MMKPVLQAVTKGMDAVRHQFGSDLVAERAVERREYRLRITERERQQRQGAGRRQPAEGGAGDKEFEPARAQIGEHLRVGTEPALGKHLEPELPAGFAADRLGHLGHPLAVGLAAGWLRPSR